MKTSYFLRVWIFLGAVFLCTINPAVAVQFGFVDIPDTDTPAIDIAGNFIGEVSSDVGGKVLFTISNQGPITSFIRQIFWEFEGDLLSDGVYNDENEVEVTALGGVNFKFDSPVNNPPQGNAISFSANLEAIADQGGSAKQGVDVGETAAFLFDGDFFEILEEMSYGRLRIAIHAQGITFDSIVGESDSYVNTQPVPEPSTVLLLGGGLLGLAAFGRKKFFKK